MEKQYNPSVVEDKIYKKWTDGGCFGAPEESKKEKYSIVIPPPNVTGILHMGHALNNTIQDILIRYKRMDGFEALWMPGTDHAGIATQNVVERKIAAEGKNRHELGRETFIKKVWEWKDEYHKTITGQLKKLGCSCDWEKERFTMDEGLSRAVRKVFVSLYREGLIYRGKYIINWCPRCCTALSDEEAEHRDRKGRLWYFKYPLKDGEGYVTVATTRPETMLGDTAVAVNPADERFSSLVGKKLVLPLVEREIPVISDDFVESGFGTGAVKVTPAHDPNDFEMGLRHKMEPVVVIDETGRMCGGIPEKYRGMDRFDCRKELAADMEKAGLLEKTEEHDHSVGECYRCHTTVEPYLSNQWFVKMKPLAEPALKAAAEDRIKFYPSRWKKIYIQWMENIRDWCISRQIWWGHRIPVWYCDGCGEIVVEEKTPKKCPSCGSDKLSQDEDVLDTWFSSWLWPFSTMGWPDDTELMKKYYPTDTLVTAPEILFFWVARMIMAGIHFTGKLPFTDVVLHGTVRDKTGKKMSKSLGNSIDPLLIIDDYGTDALRFSMMMITAQGADVYLGKDTFDIGRNFANKIWNASRFLLERIDGRIVIEAFVDKEKMGPEDFWIMSRLSKTTADIRRSIESYRFNEACRLVYEFVWHEFCDWFIEMKKEALNRGTPGEKEDAMNICGYLLASLLKILHPFMPYLTEEIWSNLREKIEYRGVPDSQMLINADFPKADNKWIDEEIENEFSFIMEIITSLRTMRSENSVPPGKKGKEVLVPDNDKKMKQLGSRSNLIKLFANLEDCEIKRSYAVSGHWGRGVVKGCEIYLSLEGLIDTDIEIKRLAKEIDNKKRVAAGALKRLENESFIKKAPEAVVEREKEKHKGLVLDIEKLEDNLKKMKEQNV